MSASWHAADEQPHGYALTGDLLRHMAVGLITTAQEVGPDPRLLTFAEPVAALLRRTYQQLAQDLVDQAVVADGCARNGLGVAV